MSEISISRIRRELQATFISLRSEENIKKLREEQEEKYRDFFR